jgi:hypothetical protein
MTSHRLIAHAFAHDTGTHSHYIESRTLKCPAKNTIHLVAPSATPPFDNFSVRGTDVESDGSTQLNIEILERHAELMRQVQRLQRVEIETHRSAKSNSI